MPSNDRSPHIEPRRARFDVLQVAAVFGDVIFRARSIAVGCAKIEQRERHDEVAMPPQTDPPCV